MFDRKKGLVALIIGFLSALLLVVVLFKSGGILKIGKEKQSPEKFDWTSLEYSRISFFNGASVRASLNIPEIWEGKYRMKEEGDSAIFYFLDKNAQAEKMFAIIKKNNFAPGEKVICEKDDFKFVMERYQSVADTVLADFQTGLDFIAQSAKCY